MVFMFFNYVINFKYIKLKIYIDFDIFFYIWYNKQLNIEIY